MLVSIIIPYYSGWNVLDNCLNQLISAIDGIECEILLVNDNPLSSVNIISDNRIRKITNSYNGGYSSACNLGAQEAQGKYIIFMDSDILPTRSGINALLKYANQTNGNRFIVGSQIVSLATGLLTHYGVSFYESDVLKPLRNSSINHQLTLGDHTRQAITSGFMLIPSDFFSELGGFDELLFNSYGDLDISMRVNEAQGHCHVLGGIHVYHRGKVSGAARINPESDTKALFFKRWGNIIQNDHLKVIRSMSRYFVSHHKLHKAYAIVDFSRSLFHLTYLKAYQTYLGYEAITVDRFYYPLTTQAIHLEDILSSSLLCSKTPFLFLMDDYRVLANNYFWFNLRKGKGDIVADINGNIVISDSFIKKSS